MATWFVSAVNGNNANAGTSWGAGNAKQTVAGAIAAPVAAGDIIAVDAAGTFTASGAITWTPPAGALTIVSSTAGSAGTTTITPSPGATEAVGASAGAFTIAAAAGSALFVSGVTLSAGSTSGVSNHINISNTASVNSYILFRSCTLSLPGTATAVQLKLGVNGSTTIQGTSIRFRDCTFSFGSRAGGPAIAAGQAIIEIINPTFAFGATQPASLFGQLSTGSSAGMVTIRDGDLSAYNAANAYVSLTNITAATYIVKNCKTSATPALTTGSWPVGSTGSIELRNVDSGNTTYTFQYQNANGTLTQDTTVYNNADTQFGGATNVSWKIVTTANAGQLNPFVSPPIEVWTTKTTAQTCTVEIAQASGASNLTDQDIWPDLEYAASASFPNYTYASGRNAAPITGTGVNWTTSTATWTGLTTPVLQKLNPAGNGNTFTAAAAGLLTARIFVGKASTTVYIDPQLTGIS